LVLTWEISAATPAFDLLAGGPDLARWQQDELS